MKAEFEDAIGIILEHEGGYVHDPDDPGGETNYGISKRSYPHEDIKNLTLERAKEIYEADFWKPCRLDEVESQPVANVMLDMAVNMGISRAVKIAQNALNSLGSALSVDGKIGMKTLKELNSFSRSLTTLKDLVNRIVAERREFYNRLVKKNRRYSKFHKGWARRAESFSIS